MTKSIKEKFENIIIEKLPKQYQYELENIIEDTDNFTAVEEILKAWTDGFNYIYATIEKKYPTALKDYTPPQPTEAELKAIQDKKDFEKSIEAGDKCFDGKDFEGAIIHFNAALELKVNDELANQKLAEAKKQDKIAKAVALTNKFKKPATV